MCIQLEVVHHIRGRARLGVESPFEPKVFFVVIEAALREIEELRRFDLNPLAKSVTLYYKEDIELSGIVEKCRMVLLDIVNDPSFAKRFEEIEEALTYADRQSINVAVRDHILTVTNNLDHMVKAVTGHVVDIKTLLSVTSFSAGLATLALAPGLPTPAWLVLLTFGLTAFQFAGESRSISSTQVDSTEYQEPIRTPESKLREVKH
jgi:hypothetical protein